MSDVPLGVFLSGGIDSSALAAMAAAPVTEPLQTFAVGFAEARGQRAALRAAGARTTSAPSIARSTVTPEEFFEALPHALWHEDEPMAFPSSVPLYFAGAPGARAREGRADRRGRRRAVPRLQPLPRHALERAARAARTGRPCRRAARRAHPRRGAGAAGAAGAGRATHASSASSPASAASITRTSRCSRWRAQQRLLRRRDLLDGARPLCDADARTSTRRPAACSIASAAPSCGRICSSC